MEISEAKVRKIEMESKILQSISNFEEQTGFSVEYINLFKVYMIGGKAKTVHIKSDVKL